MKAGMRACTFFHVESVLECRRVGSLWSLKMVLLAQQMLFASAPISIAVFFMSCEKTEWHQSQSASMQSNDDIATMS